MANVFLAKSGGSTGVIAPPLPVRVPASWPGLLSMTWTTADGDTFDLLDPDGGVILASEGVMGMEFPEVKPFRDELAGVDGSVYRGHRYPSREVFWPLLVFTDQGSDAWVGLNRRVFKAMHPRKVGTWKVVLSSGETRSLRIRYSSGANAALASDPSRDGWLVHGLTFMADEPLWTGDPIPPQTWSQPAPIDFFGAGDGTGMGPPFGISSASTIDSAWVANPGDEPVWPVWRADGPLTSVTFGVSGQQVQVPFSLPAGRALVIDTTPTSRKAIEYAVSRDVLGAEVLTKVAERNSDLGSEAYAPIPPGESVPLSLSLVGTGSVTASLVPRFMSAFS